MANVLNFPSKFNSIVVEGTEYTPDKEGNIKVTNGQHLDALKRLGCFDPLTVRTLAPPSARPTAYRKAARKAEIAAEKASESLSDAPVASPAEDAPAVSEVTPDDNWKRNDIVTWLAERGVVVHPTITKVAALEIVKDHLEENKG